MVADRCLVVCLVVYLVVCLVVFLRPVRALERRRRPLNTPEHAVGAGA
jgi:hypothetical protein